VSELAKKLIQQALSLPPYERAVVAERLLLSLEPEHSESDQLWAQAAERRLKAYECGDVEAIHAEEVSRAIKNRKR
jgi:putative addiction module component (TIGR02574 family)